MFDFSAQIFNIMYLTIQWWKYSGVQSHCIDLAISSFTHLTVAIMRHGTYYETPTWKI